MKALTLHRPWNYFVAAAFKRPENRPWTPPPKMLDERIALHSGKFFDTEAAKDIQALLGLPTCPKPEDHPEGIIGTARIAGWCKAEWGEPDPLGDGEETLILGPMTGCESVELLPGSGTIIHPLVITERDKEWISGPFVWFMRDQVLLSAPVPCRGMQKLWEIPKDVQVNLDAQLQLTPVQMILPCPGCGVFHVDRGEWAVRPHHTHLCKCGREWEVKLAPPYHSTYAVGVDLGTGP